MEDNTEEQLILFAEDSLASHSVSPGSSEARKMTAHSGLKCYESYGRWDQLGSLAKMFLESSIWNSTTCYLTWKVRVTPAKHLLFQLVPSMPSTDEIGSGSLLHTPTSAAMAEDIKNLQNRGRDNGNLEEKVALEPVKMWPTPSANQAGEGDFMQTLQTKDGRPAEPGRRAYDPKTGKHSQITLNRAVKLWPTPTVQDSKNNGSKSQQERHMKPLNAEVRGALNPEWVEWLMGFPAGWTNLKEPQE